MDNAKWTGNAGTDQWNMCIAHNDVFLMLVYAGRSRRIFGERITICNSQPQTLNFLDVVGDGMPQRSTPRTYASTGACDELGLCLSSRQLCLRFFLSGFWPRCAKLRDRLCLDVVAQC